MFTVVPREIEISHPPQTEIIDHNAPAKVKTPSWKKGKHSGNIPYDTLKEQRDKLAEAEKKYRARIKELEGENAELSKTYEATYQENKMLKGIIQHGPDASKVKGLMKVKKEQKGTIDRLEEENETLNKRLNEIEEIYNARGQTAESTWNELLAKLKKRRPDAEKVPTHGPFAGHTHANAVTVYNQKQEMDAFDRHLDNLEKETQILLNKIRQLQNEKGQIGSAIDKEKGYITRNAAVNNALNEKLNRDLNNFASKLEKLKLRHKTAKTFAGMTGKVGHKHAFNFESPDPGENVSVSSALVSLQDETSKMPTVPLTNDKKNELKSPKLNNTLKSIEMKSPKLDPNVKTIEMKSPKQLPNAKALEINTPKTQAVVSSSKKQFPENNKTVVDRRPKTDDQFRSNKVTPRLNKSEDSRRESKASVAVSSTEANYSAANTVSNFNGSRVTIAKTEKQTVITFSPDIITNSENQPKGSATTFSNKAIDAKSKRNIPNGLIGDIIAEVDEKTPLDETRSGKAKQESTNKGRKENVSTTHTGTNKKDDDSDSNKLASQAKEPIKTGNGSLTGGRYTHGPEPIPRKFIDPFERKPNRYSEIYTKRKENFGKETEQSNENNMHYEETGMKLNFTDKVGYATVKSDFEPRSLYKYGFPVRKNSKHIEDEAPNDAVLTYLRNRPRLNENPVTFDQEFADAKEKGSPSPIPIRFNDDAKTVGSDEMKFILTAKRPSYSNVYG